MLCLQPACAVDLSPLEQIAVQEGGRKKPFLVFAEESLLALTGKSALEIDDRKMHAMDLITSLWLTPDGWDTKAIILVNNKSLKGAIGLDTSRKLFSHQELTSNRQLVALLSEAPSLASGAPQSKVDRFAQGSGRGRLANCGI